MQYSNNNAIISVVIAIDKHNQSARISFRKTTNPNPSPTGAEFGFVCCGGDEGDRTPYLLNAIQALSQVSYTPTGCTPLFPAALLL